MIRPPVTFKNGLCMSIQAGRLHDSVPVEAGLALEDYDFVEIMLYYNDSHGYTTEITPKDIGLEMLEHYWMLKRIVGSYVPFSHIFTIKDVIEELSENEVRLIVENKRARGFLDK